MVVSRKAAIDTEAVQTTNNSIIALAISRNIVNWVLTTEEYITKASIVSKPLSKVKKHFFACRAHMLHLAVYWEWLHINYTHPTGMSHWGGVCVLYMESATDEYLWVLFIFEIATIKWSWSDEGQKPEEYKYR